MMLNFCLNLIDIVKYIDQGLPLKYIFSITFVNKDTIMIFGLWKWKWPNKLIKSHWWISFMYKKNVPINFDNLILYYID